MRRRSLLGAIAAAAGGLSGCAGYRVVDADAERREDRQVTDLRQRLEARNETVSALRDDIERQRDERRASLEDRLERSYSEALDRYEPADRPFREATRAYEDSDHVEAARLYGRAETAYGESGVLFSHTVFLARDHDYDRAEAVASEASFRTTQRRFVADLLGRAATARAAGRTDLAEKREREARHHEDDADDHEVASLDSFVEAVAAHGD